MHRSRIRLSATALLFGAACAAPPGEPAPVRIVTNNQHYDLPATIAGGLVHLRLVNEGPDVYEALVVRFTDSTGRAARYVESVRAGRDFPAFAVDLGGVELVPPGDSADSWLALEPGRYAVVCWKSNHLREGMAHDFIVTRGADRSAMPPLADVTLGLDEYAFAFPDTVAAGSHVIHVGNQGREPHEFDILRLAPGGSVAEYIEWSRSGEQGIPPAKPAGGTGDLIGSREIWVRLKLAPGRYFIVCTVPRPSDGRRHYDLGMVRSFVVP